MMYVLFLFTVHGFARRLYADHKQQYDEKSRDIFGDNYPRLQEIKARYDPKNMFNKLFAIQPAGTGLSKM